MIRAVTLLVLTLLGICVYAQTVNYCGQDCRSQHSSKLRPSRSWLHLKIFLTLSLAYGVDWFCDNTLCCVGTTGAWTCMPNNAQCCATGYFCPTGYDCYVSTSTGQQYCECSTSSCSGSVQQESGTGSQSSTSSGSPKPTSTSSKNAAREKNAFGYMSALLAIISAMATLF